MGRLKPWLFAAILFFFCLYVALHGAQVCGTVTRVVDGDTIVVSEIMSTGKFRVRLKDIDAPEISQTYGRESKEHLESLVLKKYVIVDFREIDTFGRILGDVYCGETVVNYVMLYDGYAWWYEEYSKNPMLLTYQQKASENRLGLWKDDSPIPPWEYRKQNK